MPDCFKTISFEHVNSLAKILHFRTHHLWNSTTELILTYIALCYPKVIKKCSFQGLIIIKNSKTPWKAGYLWRYSYVIIVQCVNKKCCFEGLIIKKFQKPLKKHIMQLLILRSVVSGGADFGRSVNPISIRGDKLCPPNYYGHPRIFRPSDGPDSYLWIGQHLAHMYNWNIQTSPNEWLISFGQLIQKQIPV